MTMAETDTPPTTAGAADAASPVPPPAAASARTSQVVTGLALALAAASAVATGLLWQRLGQTEAELARRGTDTLAEAAAARALAAQAEAQTKELQARLGVAEIRLSEVTLQRSQLEELMLSVSRSRDDSLVQDLESALRLAVQQSQLTGSSQPLISALQGAEQRIERAAQPRLNPVQRAIARDVERIRAASLVDVPALASRLDELVRSIDELPLRNAVGTQPALRPDAAVAAVPPTPAPVAATPAAAQAVEAEASGSAWEGAWSRFNDWRAGVMARWWAHFRQGTADLIRVSRIDQPDAALLAPEQSHFLRENIKLKLLNARLGMLARQFDTAQSDVQAAQRLLERYFDTAAPATRLATQTLGQLYQDLRQDALPRPDDTLAALAVAASGR
ncbi:uroporphyrinogen-III C-methyltransferase [Macromonas nakdongensis]|uniref:uroporphyrinogen-III C-methyltransferase n=1 Tax=Macromonas nakdongensis TaxID=1843082 RepID=UPI000C31D50D|nr:uroporphyrinogen-III C-methyltransferase [Macromonas nakdongensis]